MLEIRIILLSIDLKHLRRARSLYEKLHIGKILRLIARLFSWMARRKSYMTVEDITKFNSQLFKFK